MTQPSQSPQSTETNPAVWNSGGHWRLKTLLGLAAVAALLLASTHFLRMADDSKPADWNESRLTYLPSGKYLKPMMMDLDEAAADILWIQGVIYFADAYLQHKSYEWLGHILDIVTLLNPHFQPAYELGGVVLTKDKSELPRTLRLLDRGIENFPDNWKLHLYAAMAQLALDSNYTRAAEYLKPVALSKDVPDYISNMCATFLGKGGGRRVALTFLVDSYIHSNNAINNEIFVAKILKLYPNSSISENVRRQTVTRVLQEVSQSPQGIYMGLGVLHEFLSDSLSEPGRRLLNMLR